MESADAFELKAQALNNDPRLKEAGISALKFTGDKKYIADGEFSLEPPPPITPEPDSDKAKSEATIGKRLRVVLRMLNEDSYELKAQALNDDPRLKDAGISALKFASDKQYISGGEFSPEVPPPSQKPDLPTDKKVRVTLKISRHDAYELIARHLNADPELLKAGISGVELVKGVGMVPVATKEIPQQPAPAPAPTPPPAPAPKKKRSPGGCLVRGLIFGVAVLILAFGAIMLVPGLGGLPFLPVPTATEPLATTTSTSTQVPASITPSHTATSVTATNTQRPTATKTKIPTLTQTLAPLASCQVPELGTVIAGSLSCRYGPGASYLYRYGLFSGNQVQILGRADTAFGTWIYVQTETEDNIKCWINSSSRFVEFEGDVACLESYYPERGSLPIFNTTLFPAPSNVEASRSGNQVFISWTGYDLALGDRESETSPRYLVELWTCQAGKLVFTPMGVSDVFAAVVDEAGCPEPSHGQVFLAHKDGYIGPSFIPWPQ